MSTKVMRGSYETGFRCLYIGNSLEAGRMVAYNAVKGQWEFILLIHNGKTIFSRR